MRAGDNPALSFYGLSHHNRLFVDWRVLFRERRNQNHRAVPAADRQGVELDGEARLVVLPSEGYAHRGPIARAGTSLGPDIERDLSLLRGLACRPTHAGLFAD